ncbi:FYN-binding protein 1 [Echeneis naucrates]|uniref:FYN-binding protein 1 n=1 Tax=Echeneis naucrates TaxID=173247 RepID=UPI001113BEB9|nr:FYN-binding protein 1-like [Echeneis naucrates]
MGESVDVKALRARFNSRTATSDTSSRDSGSPKSPRPDFGRTTLMMTDGLSHHRLSPTPPPPGPGPGPSPGFGLGPRPDPVRFSRAEPATFSPFRPAASPRPPSSGARAEANKVKHTGEMLQNMMLRHQRSPCPKPAQGPSPSPSTAPLPLRQQSRQRSTGEVTPLRKPLPPEGPLPLKPKRPPTVNLQPFRKFNRGPVPPTPPAQRTGDGSPGSSVPAGQWPPKPPQRSNKPSRLPHQVASIDIDDNQDPYDDIGSFERNESCSESASQSLNRDDEEEDDDDVYEFIDEDEVGGNQVNTKKHQEQEKKDLMDQQKKEKEWRKIFQLTGEVEVLHTAKVRHDWSGGIKLDLSVRQGESVEIIRVKNNPEGKWLARSLSGSYGYISNTCVDIDYEAVKRKALQFRKLDTSVLPPPPPDPPLMSNIDASNRDSLIQDDDNYDDVQPLTLDFPPPPPEISIDPRVEKELKKKFKYEGPPRVLHIMMVDPNSVLKKPGAKDLLVSQGEVLEVIQLTSSKKALCRNRFGKYGYVSRSLLLPMEGDLYDDVAFPDEVYENDITDY